jgi:hypothetical protein
MPVNGQRSPHDCVSQWSVTENNSLTRFGVARAPHIPTATRTPQAHLPSSPWAAHRDLLPNTPDATMESPTASAHIAANASSAFASPLPTRRIAGMPLTPPGSSTSSRSSAGRRSPIVACLDLDNTLCHVRSVAEWAVLGFDEAQLPELGLQRVNIHPAARALPPDVAPAAAEAAAAAAIPTSVAVTATPIVQSRASQLYFRARPHVRSFLRRLSETGFTLWVFTAGSREYAHAVLKLLDPSREFLDPTRVCASDCLSFSNGRLYKDIVLVEVMARVSASRILVLDDRSDVWKLHDADKRVLQVPPFVFSPQVPSDGDLPNALDIIARRCVHLGRKIVRGEAKDFAALLTPDTSDDAKRPLPLVGCRLLFLNDVLTDPTFAHALEPGGWLAASRLGYRRVDMPTTETHGPTHLVTARFPLNRDEMTSSFSAVAIVHPDWLRFCALYQSRMSETMFTTSRDLPWLTQRGAATFPVSTREVITIDDSTEGSSAASGTQSTPLLAATLPAISVAHRAGQKRKLQVGFATARSSDDDSSGAASDTEEDEEIAEIHTSTPTAPPSSARASSNFFSPLQSARQDKRRLALLCFHPPSTPQSHLHPSAAQPPQWLLTPRVVRV